MKLINQPFFRYFKQNSIRGRLFIYFISLVVLPLLLLGTISYFVATNALERNIIKSSSSTVDQISLHLELYLRQYRQVSLSVLGNQFARDFLSGSTRQPKVDRSQIRSLRRYLFDPIMIGNFEIEGIYLMDVEGSLVGLTKNQSEPFFAQFPKLQKIPAWIRSLPPDGSMMVSGIHPSFSDPRRPIIRLGRQIYTPGMPERPLGFFWIDLSLTRIQEICEQIRLGKSGYLMIMDTSGRIIFHPKTNYIGAKYPFSFCQKILAEQSGNFLTNIEGEKSLVVFDTTGDTDWRVVAVVPYAEIGSGVLRLRSITTLMIIICIVASVILSITFAATITKPIQKLQKTMEEASRGYLDLAIPVESTDEIGKLTANFNQMLIKIKTLIDDNYTAKLREANAELKHHQAELRALQAQINPHFLFNTLGTISSLAELEGVESISRMAEALADFFRYSIHTDEVMVTLRDELAQVERYFSIQKLRFGDRIELTVDIPDELMDQPIIKLTLQPIVENACVHGLELYGNGRIQINSRIYQDHLAIMISDNGSGISREDLLRIQGLLDHPESDTGESRIGIGLRNVHSRLKLYYGEEYGIQIQSKEGEGTNVIVLLPYRSQPQK